jgi:chromatin remodeling complex protein RSC6
MKTNQEKTMHSLLQKLNQLETQSEVRLMREEAALYQTDSMDELPVEDQLETINDTEDES